MPYNPTDPESAPEPSSAEQAGVSGNSPGMGWVKDSPAALDATHKREQEQSTSETAESQNSSPTIDDNARPAPPPPTNPYAGSSKYSGGIQ